MSTPRSLVDGWARGSVPLRDVLGASSDALAAARELAERCLALGDVARAEALFAGVSVLEPGDPRAAAALAELAIAAGRPHDALAWAERTLSLAMDPHLAAIRDRAAAALRSRG